MGSMTALEEEQRELWEALKAEAGRRPEEQSAIEYLLAHLSKDMPSQPDAASHLGHRC